MCAHGGEKKEGLNRLKGKKLTLQDPCSSISSVPPLHRLVGV